MGSSRPTIETHARAAPRRGPSGDRALVVVAFACIYLIWGSTFLAIRWAVEVLPPFLMSGSRAVVAGGVLYLWERWRGEPRPALRHWRSAAFSGALLFVGCHGLLGWAERFVASGIAALFLATIPVWMVLLQARARRPRARMIAGIVLGFAGVALLVIPTADVGAAIDPLGGFVLLFSALCWAGGSLYSRSASLPANTVVATALQLLAGGTLAWIVGGVLGEVGELDAGLLASRSFLAYLYLTICGSLVGFSAYVWLLRRCEPAVVGSYAFVNPVVAVFLGWSIGGESLAAMAWLAAAVIVVGVYLVTTAQHSQRSGANAGDTET